MARSGRKTRTVHKDFIEEFLDKCCVLQFKPGRGKPGSLTPPKIETVDYRFKEYTNIRNTPWSVLHQKCFTKNTDDGVWCYQFDKKVLLLNPEAPKVREA